MKKIDIIISAVIGFFIGVFFLIIIKNLGTEILYNKYIQLFLPYSCLLIIIFPLLSLLGMYIVSFLGRKFLIVLQAGKFALVGAFNTFIDLGVLNILIWISGVAAGFLYSAFKGISFLVATINSYFFNKYWTFKKGKTTFVSREFSKFIMVTAIGFLLNVGIASFMVNIVEPQFGIKEKVWASIGALTATLTAWVWNFLLSKFIVFKK